MSHTTLASPEELRQDLLSVPGFVEPDGQHHEFANNDHGQKFDWGAVTQGTVVYEKVAASVADNIQEYGDPDAVLVVANGTTELGFDVVENMQTGGSRARLLVTRKNPETREVYLTPYTQQVLGSGEIKTLEILDDVGTTGSTTARLGETALSLGVQKVRVLYIMQRQLVLACLEDADIVNRSLVTETGFPTYSPEDCREFGLCAKQWELIPHGQ